MNVPCCSSQPRCSVTRTKIMFQNLGVIHPDLRRVAALWGLHCHPLSSPCFVGDLRMSPVLPEDGGHPTRCPWYIAGGQGHPSGELVPQ